MHSDNVKYHPRMLELRLCLIYDNLYNVYGGVNALFIIKGFCEALKNSSNTAIAQLVAYNSVNGQNIFASMRIAVTSGGYAVASAPTPSASAAGDEIATAGWVNSKIQLVNELPANPVAGVLYCIPEA